MAAFVKNSSTQCGSEAIGGEAKEDAHAGRNTALA